MRLRRSDSVERLTRRALRRIAFWRTICTVLLFPSWVIKAATQIILRIADVFDELSDVAFIFELEAARRYRSLTGIDLGYAVKGDIQRYAGMNPKALAQAEAYEFEDDDDA